MQRVRAIIKSEPFIAILLALAISALAYLPFIGHFGYYQDDWYSMYAARVRGPQAFVGIFGIDRPARAYLMWPLYLVFGGNPLYYNISAYIFRLAGGLSLLWLLRMFWPGRKWETFLVSLLFLIYPGFLSQPIAIDYQSHIVAIFLALFSLALTVRAFQASDSSVRLFCMVSSVLFGWAYLGQMEYYIGFELVRFALIAQLVFRDRGYSVRTAKQVIRHYLPYFLIPVLFLTWRLLLFQNTRGDTDVSVQLGRFLHSPVYTGLGWLVYLAQDFINVLFAAWALPFSRLGFGNAVPSALKVMALLASLLTLVVIEILGQDLDWKGSENRAYVWRAEAIPLGVFWIVAGLLPVTLSNNHITFFPDYSRYGLVSSPGGAILLVSLLSYIDLRPVKLMAIGLLIVSAILTHLGNGSGFAQSFSDIQNFWWQVSWRVPDMEPGTTVVAHYPRGGIRENSFVWGPASHVYYAEKVNNNGTVTTSIAALYLDKQSVLRVLNREPQILDERRGVETYLNYRNILIITQPGPDSCVQIVDGMQPVYSRNEYDSIMLIGMYSEPQHILADARPKIPPSFLFGAEPVHGWCFYYEKASLALQKGEWKSVVSLGEQAFSRGLVPRDQVEWFPFLQAYALQADSESLARVGQHITDPFIRRQACKLFAGMVGTTEAIRSQAEGLFCTN